MAPINEILRASAFIYTQLGALGGTLVYDGIAPLNAPYPFVIVQVQSPGADVMGVGTARIMATPLFLVKAVDKTRSWSTLASLADQIEARLHGTTGTTTDGRILACLREMPFSLIEIDQPTGDQYRSIGGMFRVMLQGLNY